MARDIAVLLSLLKIFKRQPIIAINHTIANKLQRNHPSKTRRAVGVYDPAIIK